MSCVRTKGRVWLAGPDLFGSIRDKALSRVLEVQKTLGKTWGKKERLWLYIKRRGVGSKNSAVI